MEMTADFRYHGPVVAFDLDDTLIGERDFCREGFNLIEEGLKRQGIAAAGLAEEMSRLLEEREPYMPAFERRLPKDFSADERTRLLDIYGKAERTLSPREGVVETLDELARRGVAMTLVTDGRGATQRAKLRSAGLEKYFSPELIFISEEQGAGKESPESFAKIVRHFPEAGRFIYIGDNPKKDIEMPAMLGWETAILAYNPDNVHERGNNAEKTIEATYNNIRIADIPRLL